MTTQKQFKLKQKGWAIIGSCGLYIGWWLTRSEAIREHTINLSRNWNYCKRKGDRAIKIIIQESI